MERPFVALAHSIKLNEAGWQREALFSLLESAFLYKKDHTFHNLTSLQDFVRTEDLTKIEVYGHELQNGVRELVKRQRLEPMATGGWRMPADRVPVLEKTVNEWMQLEEETKKQWLVYMTTMYSEVSPTERDELWDRLTNQFLPKVFLRRGAEVARLIYRDITYDEGKFLKGLNRILDESVSGLSTPLHVIARKEFPAFFGPSGKERTKYLIGLLDSAFSHFALSMPPEHVEKIRELTSFDLTLFLDTNFLFSALELHDHHLNESVREIFVLLERLTKLSEGAFKAKLRYASDTLDEFRRKIKSSFFKVKTLRLTKAIARTAIASNSFKGIELRYFEKFIESEVGVEPEEYFGPYRKSAPRLLRDTQIDIYVDQQFESIRNSQPVIDDIFAQMDYLKSKKRERLWETVQHDIRMWHYVKTLRKAVTPGSSLLENKYFILTCDYGFCSFDRFKGRGTEEDPICLLPPDFLQILSLFIPRTDDFESAFIHSLKIPAPKSADQQTEMVSLKILGTIARYSVFSEDIAVELLRDQTLRSQVKDVEGADELSTLIEDRLSWKLKMQTKKYEADFAKFKAQKAKKLGEKDLHISRLQGEVRKEKKKMRKLEVHIAGLNRFKSDVETKEKARQTRNEGYKAVAARASEGLAFAVVTVLIYLVLAAYVPWVTFLGRVAAVGMLLFVYVFFRYRKFLTPLLTTILRWTAIVGSIMGGAKILYDFFRNLRSP